MEMEIARSPGPPLLILMVHQKIDNWELYLMTRSGDMMRITPLETENQLPRRKSNRKRPNITMIN
jgi:hypothetical protein